MSYTIEWSNKAKKSLRKLPPNIQNRIKEAVDNLANESKPLGCKKLVGNTSYRIRVGNYRIIYDIEDDVLIITIIKIGHRKDVYDNH